MVFKISLLSPTNISPLELVILSNSSTVPKCESFRDADRSIGPIGFSSTSTFVYLPLLVKVKLPFLLL